MKSERGQKGKEKGKREGCLYDSSMPILVGIVPRTSAIQLSYASSECFPPAVVCALRDRALYTCTKGHEGLFRFSLFDLQTYPGGLALDVDFQEERVML